MIYINDDLAPDAMTEFADQGIVELEAYLLNRARFDDYCDRRDSEGA